MELFTIHSTINGIKGKLSITIKESSIRYFYIYEDDQWLCTLIKNDKSQYKLLSYGNQPISQKDINYLGKQIDLKNSSKKIALIFSPSHAA